MLNNIIKKEVEEMVKAGFIPCLYSDDWKGGYPRHCNACIKLYKKLLTKRRIK